jgi:putative transposase
MGRVRRVDVGEMVYHALNRANFRSRLFKSDAHYEDFFGIVQETLDFVPMRILAYCLMPNHWHLVLYPRGDGDLARFLQRLTLTHTQRYHARTRTVGYGRLYQGRYKSLPVESDGHFLALVRYVERNAKRAALVKRAEDWRWSSVHIRLYGNAEERKILSPWPTPEPPDYLRWLNHSQPKEEVENIRYAIKRSRPYGSEKWVAKAAAQFGLETTIRNPWRPGKDSPSSPIYRKGT